MPLRPRFVPILPEPPELAAAVRRAERCVSVAAYNEDFTCVYECQNDTMLMRGFYGKRPAFEVHWPLRPHRGVLALPVTPYEQLDGTANHFLLKDDGGRDRLVYVWLSMGLPNMDDYSVKYKAHIYVLQQDGASWRWRASAAAVLPSPRPDWRSMLVGTKIYMPHSTSIAALDLKTSSFSAIPLPPEMEEYVAEDMMLAPAHLYSSIFLVHLDEDLQLHVWLYVPVPGFNCWLLLDVVSLPKMFEALGMTGWTDDDQPATQGRAQLFELVYSKFGNAK